MNVCLEKFVLDEVQNQHIVINHELEEDDEVCLIQHDKVLEFHVFVERRYLVFSLHDEHLYMITLHDEEDDELH